MSDAIQGRCCTFVVDGLLLGVDVLKVQEVIRYQEMTRVPGAPHVVTGLINLRGQLVTALDLRKRLELSPRNATDLPMNVVVRTDDGATSLLVDDIGDVIEVRTSDYEPTPKTIPPSVRKYMAGVYKLKDSLLSVIDTDRLFKGVGHGV